MDAWMVIDDANRADIIARMHARRDAEAALKVKK
jgi:predicted Fe-S protein YdhL (DUF1289 family)